MCFAYILPSTLNCLHFISEFAFLLGTISMSSICFQSDLIPHKKLGKAIKTILTKK